MRAEGHGKLEKERRNGEKRGRMEGGREGWGREREIETYQGELF